MLNLSLSPTIRILVYSLPPDMRRQFDGLSALVGSHPQPGCVHRRLLRLLQSAAHAVQDPLLGAGCFALYARRLERGTFQLPAMAAGSLATPVDALTLAMMLGGVDLASAKRRPRYQHVAAVESTNLQLTG